MSQSNLSRSVISIYFVYSLLICSLIGNNIIYNENNKIIALAITVNDDGGADYNKIQDAINNATIGNTIYVWAGTYYENIIINKSITLIGNGTEDTIINGSGIGDVVYITANWVNISNFAITNSGNQSFNWDHDTGIEVNNANNVMIKNNNCFNNDYGIYFYNSNLNFIINNTCDYNRRIGIDSTKTNNSKFQNNSCKFNIWYGISLYLNCNSNKILNNNCSYNKFYNVFIFESDNNIIANNICNRIKDGLFLAISNNNYIYENIFSNNNNAGIWIDEFSFQNKIYHNHIISNNIQAVDNNGNNFWNNSAQEGNYWSDYTGKDTGNKIFSWDTTGKHLIVGDGIGDTKVPHLELDYYPFTNQLGWLKPGIPNLNDPGEVDSDGNYSILWNATARTIGYVFEEDNSSDFNNPTELYNGSDIEFNISGRQNDTYYYHIKAYNEKYQSAWSNIVDIIVDWPPDIPENLQVSTYPPGNSLNISWDMNLVDTDHYELEFKNETMGDWKILEPVLHPGFTYNHNGLIDGEEYDYHIRARDHRGQFSNYSAIISGIPWDSVPPKPPTGLQVVSTTYNSTTLTWDSNAENDLEGYNIFRSEKSNPSEWGEPIYTIEKGIEENIDTGLDEETTYYYVITAFDEVPNESGFSNLAQGITTLGPQWPMINNSIEDFEIPEDTIDNSINLYYWFKDVNNDLLEFRYKGQQHINVTIHQNNGTVTLKPEKNWNGKETLIFYANDSVYNIFDNVTITVMPVNDAPGPAVIVEPEEGLKTENGTGINFSGICDDVDLIYGDKLTFKWYSNISGGFGEGKNLTNVLLPQGAHQIRLEVSDIAGEKSTTNVKITIIPDYIPNFEIDLKIRPDVIELLPGGQKFVKAYVFNLGIINDTISLHFNISNDPGIEISINGSSLATVKPNGSATIYNIIVKVPKDISAEEIEVIFTATSEKAIDYDLEITRNATLTIKIIEDKETSNTDTISKNVWFYIFLVIIIIVILICIFMLIVTRKKRAKQKPLPTVEAEIEEPGELTLPGAETAQGQVAPTTTPEKLPATITSDGSQPQTTLSPIAKKQEQVQMPVPLAKQAPRLPPGQVETTEESSTEDEEKLSLEETEPPSEHNKPNQEQHTAQETSSSD